MPSENKDKKKEFVAPSQDEHTSIAKYLEKTLFEYIDRLSIDDFTDREKELLRNVLEGIFYCYKNSQSEISRYIKNNFGKYIDRSNISRYQDDLNELLLEFCLEKQIDPPIQIFHYHMTSAGARKRIQCHLACAHTEIHTTRNTQRQYSRDIVPLAEAKQKIDRDICDTKITPCGDIYKQSLIHPQDLPGNFIECYGTVSNDTDQIIEREQILSDSLLKYRKLKLVGDSGSGKTMLLKALIATLLEQNRGKNHWLPIFIPLKSYGQEYESLTDLISSSVLRNIINHVEVPTLKREIGERRKNYDTLQSRGLTLDSHEGREKLCREYLENEVKEWITSDDVRNVANIILLLDGFDEIALHYQVKFITELEELLNPIHFVVLSSRTDVAFHCDTSDLYKFKIDPINSDQIIKYLDEALPEKGSYYFKSNIESNPDTLSMAQNPFFLHLIAEVCKENTETSIESKKATLIQVFVNQLIKKRIDEGVMPPDRINIDLMFDVLPRIAKWCIDCLTQEGESSSNLIFHTDYHSLQKGNAPIYDVLKLSEKYGILKTPGAWEIYPGTENSPEFVHDNIRDFFASLYLLKYKGLSHVPDIEYLMEFFEWDNAMNI